MDGKNILPSNKRYKTQKINGYNAVHIGDLPLQYGRISSQNSMPYIREDYVDKLLQLDQQMGKTGNRYKITSNIGGKHATGPRSHSNFEKIDIAPENGTIFNQAGKNYLTSNWVGNGAIGPESDHWDLSFNPKGGRLMDQNVMRPGPNFINANPQLQAAYNQGMLTNAQAYDELVRQQNELARRYDIAAARNSAQQNIDEATNQYVDNINEQMYQNIDDPIVYQMQQQRANQAQEQARGQAVQDLNEAKAEYYLQRTPKEMADMYDDRVNRFLQAMNMQNPYTQLENSGVQYNIDENTLRNINRQANLDRAYSNVMMGRAMMHAKTNPQLAAVEMAAAQRGQNIAEQMIRQAQNQYYIDAANRLGIPPEAIQQQSEHQMKMAEALAPGASSAYKEASVLQPNQNLRTFMTEIPKNSEKIYSDTVEDEQNRMKNLLDRNKIYTDINKVAGGAQANSLADITEMQRRYPQQALEKYQTHAGSTSKADQALIQGTSSMTGNLMKEVGDNVKNINTQAERVNEEQGKDYRKALDIVQQQNKTQDKKEADPFKEAQKKNSYVSGIVKQIADPLTGYLPQDGGRALKNALMTDGILSNKEIAGYIMRYYPKGVEKK
ncbi:MAG: hypothetical protein J6Y02_13220 [Pseudobutyrivibrio sp.]|nr:hypothetical protein [Pseudobutyrivibrio sp.]